MIHTYQLTGMTCSGCEEKVKSKLLALPDIVSVILSKESNTATIEMNKHVPIEVLQEAIGDANSKYQISATRHNELAEQAKSWGETYKPILLIFGYILTVTVLVQFANGRFSIHQWMQYFMAGFFLTFSFFKMLNLSGFADSYSMYDIIAKRFKAWGYVYAFIELGLGIAYATSFQLHITNLITFIVMGISIIGVLQSVLNKRKIQCACLGAVFNLPMSTITIIEDALMIVMSSEMISGQLHSF